MEIPILRFPGGTAIDYYPWYYLIDSFPGKHSTRPRNLHYKDLSDPNVVTSNGRMGLHEYIALCHELNIEPHLVTNLGDAYFKKIPIEQAAEELGSALVEYCNATEGKWAELRAANGNPEPFNVKYFQIGNETWLFDGLRKENRGEENFKHYTDCVIAYAKAMKAADPSIVLIIDGEDGLSENVMKEVGDLIAFQTFHSYSPWGIQEIKRGDKKVPADSVTAAEVWQGLAAAPAIDPETGLSKIWSWALMNIDEPLSMTEWNLNCWFQGDAKPARPENELLAYGIGAGSYLNALLRISDKVKIANQSMLVGTGWGITGIRVDTTETVRPTMYPTGMATGLYARNHGDKLMGITGQNVHFYEQPLKLSGISPSAKVAEQDVVVTADEEYYFVHVVNRSFENARDIKVVFPKAVKQVFTHFLLSDQSEGSMSKFANIDEIKLNSGEQEMVVNIPARSVSVVRFEKE